MKITDIIKNKDTKNEPIDMDYTCDYCGYPFEQRVRSVKGQSDAVQCPNCKNYLKTWS